MRCKKLSDELWFFILPSFISEFERYTMLKFLIHSTFTKHVSGTHRKQGHKLLTKAIFCNLGIFPEVGHHDYWTARHHKIRRSPRPASNITRLSSGRGEHGDFTVPHKFWNLLLYNTITTLLITVCFFLCLQRMQRPHERQPLHLPPTLQTASPDDLWPTHSKREEDHGPWVGQAEGRRRASWPRACQAQRRASHCQTGEQRWDFVGLVVEDSTIQKPSIFLGCVQSFLP